jgi:DNA-binding LacI/PurR family transcriptional regulator
VWRTVKGFQDAATQAGRRVVMLSAGSDYLREMEMIARLSEFDVRGAVLFPVIQTPEDQVALSRLLVESRFPIVLAGMYLPGLGRTAVMTDGFHAGYTMTRHMLSRERRQVGFFSNYAWAPFMRDRYLGYRWALEEAGIPESADIVYLDPVMTPNFEDPLAESRTMARTYLQRAAGKVDAVVCADDLLALGFIEAAGERGLKVPGDLLVSGIDDYSSLPQISQVELTTYHIPFEEMGCRAFGVLDTLLEKEADQVGDVQLRGKLVIRRSA